jgi:DNA (cytosine-5)-methyltransferase 1
MDNNSIRRLVPAETEALQGFPKGYTAIPYKGKAAEQCPDGPRYKAIGNTWAVPCAAWIGKRIQLVEDKINDPIRPIRP